MLTFRARLVLGIGALALASVAAACDLNPQPLPPGFAGGDTNPGAGDTDASTTGGGAMGPGPDGGSSNGADAGLDSGMPPVVTSDAGADAGDAGPADGGDAGADAGDASDDDASDGGEEAG